MPSPSPYPTAEPAQPGKPAAATAGKPPGRVGIRHTERLWLPLWWWPFAFGVMAILAAEIHMGSPGIRAWLPYAVLLPLPVFLLLWAGRRQVQVVAEPGQPLELRTGRARLPVTFIARAAAVPASAKSTALGRQLDPAAFVQHSPWIGPLLLVVLNDPDDPVPYWLISSRHPDRLLAALELPESLG